MRYFLYVCLVLFVSCGPSPIFEQSFEFESAVWSYDDHKSITFSAPDTSNQYDLILDVIHNESYAYENLYIQLQTVFPDATDITDEISIPLLGEDGHWVGKGSDQKRIRVYLQQALKFKEVGEHTIVLNQHSRDEALKHIRGVSLAIYAH